MKKLKTVTSVILALVMVISFFTTSFASNNVNAAEEKKVKDKAQTIADKYGARFEILSPEDTAKCELKFDTFEEFETYLEGLRVNSETIENVELQPEAYSPDGTLDTKVRTCTADNRNFIDFTLLAGVVRNKVIVNTSLNYDDNTYHFMDIISQTSYIGSAYYTGWTWAQDAVINDKIDGNRTLTSHIWGHSTLTAQIGSFGAGYTWDRDFYNEWYCQP